ncbi:MAG: 4a-hydroxytetrahydrobiopterin dehydratase [Nitrososphaerota archaeon]|nr:4a-hydroxytetrahydrobiopterin dehydratase [Nitrososphaerota archaeon]
MNDLGYRRLTDSEIESELENMKFWKLVEGKLRSEIDFKTFEDAIAFIVRVSLDVAKLDHHPEWFNVYNHVRIDLVTHDVNGISNYDFVLAKNIDRIRQDCKID